MIKFYAKKLRSFKGRKIFVRGPHLARGPQFADPCSSTAVYAAAIWRPAENTLSPEHLVGFVAAAKNVHPGNSLRHFGRAQYISISPLLIT